MSLMFFTLNGFFIVIVFTLQYTNAIKMRKGISIPLPCYANNGRQLTLEPISLLFMIVYAVALVIQFVSMFFHRLGTALHIMSSTDINCMKPNNREINAMDIASKIALVKEMQQMDDEDDKMSVTTTSSSNIDDDSSLTQDDSPRLKRRKTVIRITKRRKQNPGPSGVPGIEVPAGPGYNMGSKFMKNFMDLVNDLRNKRVSQTSEHSEDFYCNIHVLSQPRSSDADTKSDSLLDTYEDVVVAMRPKSDASAASKTSGRVLKSNKLSAEVRPFSTNKTPRIREDDARANSIESESEASDNSGSNSRAPSVTFNNHPEFISNFREAQSVSVPAPNDVFIDESG
ncbi:uncharacterized protein LOC127831514 [Dreissena polymorpha]|uniref:uncharacterized protein LOC127831514 n=1 Tax=Dreissena polymorpha TaxID=45954 RepID=UPI002264B02B|nr:uncharacterized protein LOC127831514 [Dreissena polymorpha]